MPGAGIPGFMRKAADIAKAGIYDLRVHRDEVLLPILRHWGIFELTGLDGAAEEARRRLAEHLDKLELAAQRFEDRMARATTKPRIASTRLAGGPAWHATRRPGGWRGTSPPGRSAPWPA